MRSPLLLIAIGAAALLPRSARADDAASRSVWIESRPWTCARETGALARDVELACDAIGGGCHVAQDEAHARQRVVLVCESENRWTLRAETTDGKPLFSVSLEGDREERLRKAAMWVARVDSEGTVADAAALPEAHERAAPAAPAPPTVSEALPAARKESEGNTGPRDAAPGTPRRGPAGGLVLDGMIGVTNSDVGTSLHGIHGAVLYPVGALSVGVAASLNQVLDSDGRGGYDGPHTADVKTAGARIGFGAPFTDHVFGAWVEAGVAWGERTGAAPSSSFAWRASSDPFVNAYGRAELVAQIPWHAPVRPFVYLAGTHTVGEFDQGVQTALVGAGLAWQAW